ncbi:unnamed protein product [Lactuca virosa]|uniref:EXS domain-containing protein n=1 Tax=Lactuca virosa TaxID=75947 RepID=A0AAU9P861_9ASTR|nr:unnamed protein product [Lactuca virosa]
MESTGSEAGCGVAAVWCGRRWNRRQETLPERAHNRLTMSEQKTKKAKKADEAMIPSLGTLEMLKTYSSLNTVSIETILKKFDRVSNKKLSRAYLEVVQMSHFVCVDKVDDLKEYIETFHTTYFANNIKEVAMKKLSPCKKENLCTDTFFDACFLLASIGFFLILYWDSFAWLTNRLFTIEKLAKIFLCLLYKVEILDTIILVSSIYKKPDTNTPEHGLSYTSVVYGISSFPYVLSVMQCVQKYRDDGDKKHLYNIAKHVFTLLAVISRIRAGSILTSFWIFKVVGFSILATMASVYWDLYHDWGLLNFKPNNKGLRDSLMHKRKYIYYTTMALNILLRVNWAYNLIDWTFKVQ